MSGQPEGFLFNRSDKVGMDGDQCDGDHALYLDDDFPGAGSLDLDKHTFASFEYSSRYPDLLRFCEIDLGGTEKTQGLVIGSRHRDECPHLLLGDSDLLAESLIHHVLQHGNAGGLLKLLDSGCGGAYEYDVVDHNVDAYLTNGMTINIIHRIPITLTVDGETTEVITSASTVEELLEEQDITVGSKDRLSKDKTASLTSGDKLVIERINVKKITETEEIEYETQTEYSGDMYAGESRVSQDGVNGEKDLTYEVTYVDGKESGRRLVSEKVTKEPVPQIVVEGTKQQETSEPGGGDGSGRTIVSKVKNYDCDGSGHGWYTITYSDGTVEYVDF